MSASLHLTSASCVRKEVLPFPRAAVPRPCGGGLTRLLFPPPPALSAHFPDALGVCTQSQGVTPLPAGLWVTRMHAVTVTVAFPSPARAQSCSFVKRQSEGDPVLPVQLWLPLGSRLLRLTAGSWAGLVHRHNRDAGSPCAADAVHGPPASQPHMSLASEDIVGWLASLAASVLLGGFGRRGWGGSRT